MSIRNVIDPDRMADFSQLVHDMGCHAQQNRRGGAQVNATQVDAVQRVALYGFGDSEFRMSLFRLLQSCFLCDWFWSAETNDNRWEMLVSFPTRYCFTFDQVERFCALCRNGVACDALDRGITVALARFFERIDNGRNHVGWVRSRLRLACERKLAFMREQEAGSRVRSETGYEFTSGNMLYLWHELQNANIELQEQTNMADEYIEINEVLMRNMYAMRDRMQSASFMIDRLRHALDVESSGSQHYAQLQRDSFDIANSLQILCNRDFSAFHRPPGPPAQPQGHVGDTVSRARQAAGFRAPPDTCGVPPLACSRPGRSTCTSAERAPFAARRRTAVTAGTAAARGAQAGPASSTGWIRRSGSESGHPCAVSAASR
eukprot:762433-Hanusia_phi.AAC.12